MISSMPDGQSVCEAQSASDKRFRAVSLFTGAGGLDAGIHQTGGFELLACVELEPQFCATLERNRDAGRLGTPSTRVISADLSTYDPYELMRELRLAPGELDLLIGGPPCQTWSTAGRRATVQDPRGMLIWDFLRFVDAFKPRMFLMENVRGLLSGALRHRPIAARPPHGGPALEPDELPGSAVAAWAHDLGKLHAGAYSVDVYEVNAANYGAPQIRERVLFFGSRLGHHVEFPVPTHGPGRQSPFRTLRDVLGGWSDPSPVTVDFSPRKKKYLDEVPPGGNWRALPDELARESMGRAYFAKGGRSGWWRRLSWDLPSPTITTLPNHASTSMCHPDETRALSVGEFARIQEFPDGWEIVGTPSQQMRQVGNAVPARLGVVAGEVIRAELSRSAAAQVTPVAELDRYRRVYLDSHVRTRRWWKDGKAYVRTDGQDLAV